MSEENDILKESLESPGLEKFMGKLVAKKKALKIPISYSEGRKVVKEYPDGRKVLVKLDKATKKLIETPFE